MQHPTKPSSLSSSSIGGRSGESLIPTTYPNAHCDFDWTQVNERSCVFAAALGLCIVQDTIYSGSKLKDTAYGFKLLHSGSTMSWNGVDIAFLKLSRPDRCSAPMAAS